MTNKPDQDGYSVRLQELVDWYSDNLKNRNRRPILKELQNRLKYESDSDVRKLMYTLLKMEHGNKSDPEGALSVAKDAVSEFPDDPLSWISLAERYALQPEQATLALETIDTAIAAARRSGTFRRQALQTKARFHRWFKRFPELEKCLIEIMQEPRSTGTDIAKEDDFIENLPPDAISPEVERAYREFMTSP